jgi:carbamoyltransferase
VRGLLDLDSPFMLLAVPVPDALVGGLTATVHVDGTARPQTVRDGDAFDALLARLGLERGVPAVLNTSLNLAGEPIAADGVRAVSVLARSRLDGLVVDDVLITRPS